MMERHLQPGTPLRELSEIGSQAGVGLAINYPVWFLRRFAGAFILLVAFAV